MRKVFVVAVLLGVVTMLVTRCDSGAASGLSGVPTVNFGCGGSACVK